MGLNCGLIGLPTCGKTVIFNAVTAAGLSSYSGAEMNRVVVSIPDRRIDKLIEMYQPLKDCRATLEVVDIAGIKASSTGDKHNTALLGHIKDVDALLHVVRCFEDDSTPFEYETIDPARDVDLIDLEMVAADSTTLGNKINRLGKKARGGDKDALRETEDCHKVYAAIQQGIPARKQDLTGQELASIRECNLLSLKPVLYVANIKSPRDAANAHVVALKQIASAEGAEMIMVCGKDEADISQLKPDEQRQFLHELGMKESSMERLLLAAYQLLGLVSFFTTGEDEVRAWTCREGTKAPVAAGKIHKDMENGFIRMEVIHYNDLIELGSEAAVARAGKQRIESRDYEVKDGDIVVVRFNSAKQ